jgi:hypothetical protein
MCSSSLRTTRRPTIDRRRRVIAVGDAQHTALGHIAPHLYWNTLRDRLS